MLDMVLTPTGQAKDAAALLKQFRLTEADLKLVRGIGKKVKPDIQAYVDEFYVWLREQPYFASFFPNEQRVEKVKALQEQYWLEFFDAE